MKTKAIIVSGGMLETEFVLGELAKGGYVIGVDKGVEFLHRNQVEMDYIVGDFDSVSPEIIAQYKRLKNIPIREFNPVKDASDTEIAVRLAIELGFKKITILGATGSRVDHMWANIQVLAIPYALGIKAEILDSVNRIRLIEDRFKIDVSELYGGYFSVFSLGGSVEGLTIIGAKYPLENHTLRPYDSLSVSNQCVNEQLTIAYQSGLLILMEIKED